MNKEKRDDELKKETRTGIRRVGDVRKKIAQLEKLGIPGERAEFYDLRDEIELLLDHLIVEDKINLETSHLIRSKLRRIDELFKEMEADGHFSENEVDAKAQLDYDKDRYDAKLEVIQLMLAQLFPKLRDGISNAS